MYRYEIDLLEAVKKQRIEKGTYVDGIIQRIAAYEREDILSFLSRKNVLPKYGFPVDTVEMTVTDAKKGRGYGLQLQRDLSMAISEYAPGSQIVANNNLITSRYIKKIPKIGWKMYSYIKQGLSKSAVDLESPYFMPSSAVIDPRRRLFLLYQNQQLTFGKIEKSEH